MQVKTAMRYEFTEVRMVITKKNIQTLNTGQGVQKRKPSYIVDGNRNWYSDYGEHLWGFLNKLKIELLCNPALDIHLEKILVQKWGHLPHCPLQHCYNTQGTEAT